MARPSSAVDYLELLLLLKTTPRAGWVRAGVRPPRESVADHSWLMAAAAPLLASACGADAARVTSLAVVHDLAEALTGDFTPFDRIAPEDKAARERAALAAIVATLGPASPVGAALLAAAEEYAAGATAEARAAKDLDKLDLIAQALAYERTSPGLDLGSFFAGVRGRFYTVAAASWATEIVDRREALRAERARAPAATRLSWAAVAAVEALAERPLLLALAGAAAGALLATAVLTAGGRRWPRG